MFLDALVHTHSLAHAHTHTMPHTLDLYELEVPHRPLVCAIPVSLHT